ncbi:hypothetical protein [Streptomyces sp. NPDC001222]|uniref:hypothetical protein n=1 Tax=Streptomyces sp. NPDC001222 TaxID=3364548 RepID=UPI00369CBD96
MPRDIDDQIRRRDREREHGEITGEDRRDRSRRDPDMSGSGRADGDVEGAGLRRERDDNRSSWDEDDEDLRDRRDMRDTRDGYR